MSEKEMSLPYITIRLGPQDARDLYDFIWSFNEDHDNPCGCAACRVQERAGEFLEDEAPDLWEGENWVP